MYKLLRSIGDVQGIARTTILALESFIESIHELKCSREEVLDLYSELAMAIKNSQPKIIPLIHLIERFEKEMDQTFKSEKDIDLDEIRVIAEKSLNKQIDLFKQNAKRVTENGLNYVQNNDVIIVHSPSSVITNILIQAKERLNLKFSVIILEQNAERTRQFVQALRKVDIEHFVTHAYDLSHHIEQANKMFFGALTITSDKKIVAPSGTAGTVSLCHINNVKVHLFANTLHYSHGKATDQLIFQQEENHYCNVCQFPVRSHSHDLVNLKLIDHIVNENGEATIDRLLPDTD